MSCSVPSLTWSRQSVENQQVERGERRSVFEGLALDLGPDPIGQLALIVRPGPFVMRTVDIRERRDFKQVQILVAGRLPWPPR